MSTATAASRQDFIAQCKAENVAFLDANRKRVYIEYVRDPVTTLPGGCIPWHDKQQDVMDEMKGKPTAVLIAYRPNENDDGFETAWSAACPEIVKTEAMRHGYVYVQVRPAEKFDKAIGLWKAIRRVTKSGRPAGLIPGRLHQKMCDFAVRASAEFNRKPLADVK